MADPATLAGVSGGAGIAGALTGAIGSLMQGQSQANMYNYQAGVAKVNAQIAAQDSNYALAAGGTEAQESGMRTGAQIGATRAGIGAGNIDATTGSGAKVIQSEHEIGIENQGIITANAAKKAYGFQVGAAEDTAQAGAYTAAASTSQTAGELGAISSIIGGAGQVSSKWLQAGQYFGSSDGNANPTTSPYSG